MNSSKTSRRVVALALGCLLLAAITGVSAAAVGGDFTAMYDGLDDGESTDARGNEIAIQGQMEVTGDPAVEPTIMIRGGQWTVLDTASVQVFVEGDRSIEFDRTFRGGEVRLSTSEIPAGTTIRLEYRTYYTGGADSQTVTAGRILFDYNRPSGDRTRESFSVDATLENRPEEFVAEANSGSQLSQIQRVLSYVGAGGIVLLLLGLIAKALGDDGPPGGGPGPG